MKYISIFLLFLTLLSVHTHAFVGVRAQSFAGSYRARASSNDIIFYNPSGLIKVRKYGFDIDYSWENDAHRSGISLVDTSTGAWGLGLAYSGLFVSDKRRDHKHTVYMATAMPIVSDSFAIGTSYHYRYDPQKGSDHAHFFNMDLGLSAHLPAGLSLAIVLDQLLKAKAHEKDIGISMATAFDLGALVPIFPLSLSFDWHAKDLRNDDLHHVISTGLEYTMLAFIPVRFGYSADMTLHKKSLSFGLGINGKFFASDFLYQQNINVGADRSFGIALRWNV
jgi:hypothetical protein